MAKDGGKHQSFSSEYLPSIRLPSTTSVLASKPFTWPLTHLQVDKICLPRVTVKLTYKGQQTRLASVPTSPPLSIKPLKKLQHLCQTCNTFVVPSSIHQITATSHPHRDRHEDLNLVDNSTSVP